MSESSKDLNPARGDTSAARAALTASAQALGLDPSQPMLAVYGRTVTWRHLILAAVGLIVLMTAVSAVAAWWAWQHLAAHVVLRDQQAVVRLPDALEVQADVSRRVAVRVDQILPVRVPLQQDISIPLKEPIPVQVSIDTVVPLALDIPVSHVIQLDQVIDVDTEVKARVLGIPLTVPVKGRVPVKAAVPVQVTIPVRKDLPVALLTMASVRVTEPLRTRIDTVIQTEVPIRESLSLPVTEPVAARLTFPQQRVQAGLERMDLTVPFEAVTLARRAPTRP